MTLLQVENLSVSFTSRYGTLKAVQNVSYSLDAGQILGVVGESGSGKSVTHYAIMDLLPKPPARIDSGSVLFEGRDLLKVSKEEMRRIRGKQISMIFQDPMTCLNPYIKVGTQLIEPLLVHENISKFDAIKRAHAILKEVGITDVEKRMNSYPHRFSGGMRQRLMIAMALITKPKLLIADEPTTALDVTVEAQIIDLIRREQAKTGMSVIFISHNLGVVAGFAKDILVMYAGNVVEKGSVDNIFYHPSHPYTKALIACLPSAHQKGAQLYNIQGQLPDLAKPIQGCKFAPRCEFKQDICLSQEPVAVDVRAGQSTLCTRFRELSL